MAASLPVVRLENDLAIREASIDGQRHRRSVGAGAGRGSRRQPTGGAVLAFCGRRGDRPKLLCRDGQGLGPPPRGARAGALCVAECDGRRRAADRRADAAARGRASTGAVRAGARRPRGWGEIGAERGLERPWSLRFVGSDCPGLVGSGVSDALPSDPAALRAEIAALQAENTRPTAVLRAHGLLIEALRARIAELQRQRFGPSSEKIEREIEQLELALEDLQVAAAEGDAVPAAGTADEADDAPGEAEAGAAETPPKPRRRPRAAEGTSRERRVLEPGEACPDCGGDLRVVGEDASELLDRIAATLEVVEIARPEASCRRCERMIQGEPSSAIGPRTMASAPSRPIPREPRPGPALAHALVSKFDDHVPLCRQAEVFARMGADIPGTTLLGGQRPGDEGAAARDRAHRGPCHGLRPAPRPVTPPSPRSPAPPATPSSAGHPSRSGARAAPSGATVPLAPRGRTRGHRRQPGRARHAPHRRRPRATGSSRARTPAARPSPAP